MHLERRHSSNSSWLRVLVVTSQTGSERTHRALDPLLLNMLVVPRPHSAEAAPIARKGVEPMQLSARNQLPGTVTAVKEGAVMAEVSVKLDAGPEIVSVITVDSARRLNLADGSKVTV